MKKTLKKTAKVYLLYGMENKGLKSFNLKQIFYIDTNVEEELSREVKV